MIAFFYVTEDTDYLTQKAGHSFVQKLLAPKNNDFTTDRLYFTTPSDLNHKLADGAVIVLPENVLPHVSFPQNIGFSNFEEIIKSLEGKTQPKVAIINAMSTAFGDHLIGMRAFDYWFQQISPHFPNLQVTFYQFDPYELYPITKQFPGVSRLLPMPNNVASLLQHDAFISLGSMVIQETFDCEPMIDFFLRSLSIDPATVPNHEKRMKYILTSGVADQIRTIFKNIKIKKRPILLFHHKSTSAIRSMNPVTARRLVREIIAESDYFVISATPLEYQHDRFLDISRFSKTFDHFAAIIAQVDAIVTVDTSTYHVADAFDIPTVAMFTSISPSIRTSYYPTVKSIMLENTKGKLYGRHKSSPKCEAEEILYVEEMWSRINGSTILEILGET